MQRFVQWANAGATATELRAKNVKTYIEKTWGYVNGERENKIQKRQYRTHLRAGSVVNGASTNNLNET